MRQKLTKITKRAFNWAGLEITRLRPPQNLIGMEPSYVFPIIAELYCSSYNSGDIVQIGANDGINADPIFQLLRRHQDHRAILVEPVRSKFESLRRNYKSRNNTLFANIGISDYNGTAEIYSFDESHAGLPNWAPLVISLDRKIVESHLNSIEMASLSVPPKIVSETIQLRTMESLIKEYEINEISILQVDTEGHDAKIVNMVLDAGLKPTMINFEAKHLQFEEIESLVARINELGYKCLILHNDLLAVDTIAIGIE